MDWQDVTAEQEAQMSKIVVGIDGSPASERALDFACDEAKLWDAELHVVHAWSYPYHGRRASAKEPRELMERDATEELDAATERARLAGAVVVPHLTEGQAVAVLIEAAGDADLLVVGSHGHGSVIGSLLGSTSQAIVHRAPCPVAVVRTGK